MPPTESPAWYVRTKNTRYQLEGKPCPGCGKNFSLSGRVCSPECIPCAGAHILEQQRLDAEARKQKEQRVRSIV